MAMRLIPGPVALFWTPYADWIQAGASTALLLALSWLALRPGRPR